MVSILSKIIKNCTLHNIDCMEYMKSLPDNAFDLAIVDPPYGIDASESFGGEQRKSGNGVAMKTAFEKKNWDSEIPKKEYFDELKRVSKNQIIWGANYMTTYLPPSSCATCQFDP